MEQMELLAPRYATVVRADAVIAASRA